MLREESNLSPVVQGLLAGAAFVVIVAGLKAAAALILPFLLSLLIATASYPMLTALRRWRVPNGIAVALTLVAVLLGITGVALLLGNSLRSFTHEVPAYTARLDALARATIDRLDARGFHVNDQQFLEWVSPGQAMGLATGLLKGITNLLSNLVLVMLTVAFLLVEATGLPGKLAAAFGGQDGSRRLTHIQRQVQRFLLIKAVMSLMTGVVIGSGLALMGVDFPLLWGMLAFLLNFIPTIGSIIAAVPAVLLTLVQLGPGRALAAGILFLAVNMVIGNLIEPAFTGRRLGLSSLVVFMSLLFWGWVWGPTGMILSVPLTMILKIFMENSRSMRWLAVLLEAAPAAPAAAAGPGAGGTR